MIEIMLYQLPVLSKRCFLDYNEDIGVSIGNYVRVWKHTMESINDDIEYLEYLYYKLNEDHPDDYHARSMSVSDIVCIKNGRELKWYYTESIGFKNITSCIQTNYNV